ncbi:SRPBCC domain-containing protein [Pedobacter sp. HDW13]|uniref:SRPBCC family protein n=1 Tax=unclassified Pedobacter TaxID=2628915 RepID=UPI000F5A58AE|nr:MULTISPECIES: SRPBCC domain-containing protein [unclassified Pedobacter]QIL41406.1 SRPBCC domain-containing protein [Pedobacter sp. HDW13]RQO78021.1 ATPase [Pedobacter sp. KBW01]
MEKQNFTAAIEVDQSPKEVINAITNVRGWWSEDIEGNTAALNAEFIYHYRDVHYCKAKLIELVADQKVVWQVLDNYFNFIDDKSEWIGTKLVFDISTADNKTVVTFTHEGLVPQYECFEICREAWTNYIKGSLYQLITTGKGQPNPKEGDGYNTELAKKWQLEA